MSRLSPSFESGAGSNSEHLTKRARYGWVTIYAADDPTCSRGYLAGFRPKMHEDCIAFNAPDGANDYVGINWGSSPMDFTGLQGYSDANCKNAVGV
ncbi:hypothetical protein ABVK25_012274 [Lepraria finkii]|uniref:Uncharacterized protein n=1 Tax=Lepraria finkii TaxID=1340010 RepID=A0ABR4AHI3_9LECA